VGEAGLEPAHPLLIRQVPSPFGHSPSGSESQVRTDDLRLMRAPLWPAELSRRGQSWSRTRRLPLYQSGPFTGWVIAQVRKMEVSSPTASRPPRAFKARCRAGGASSLCGERRTRTATLARPSAFGAVPARRAGSLSMRLQRCVYSAHSGRAQSSRPAIIRGSIM
jgi:hypothetical protein